MIGADRIADGTTLYGNFPRGQPDRRYVRTGGLLRLRPVRAGAGLSGTWDDLPAAHAAAIFFDLGTMVGLFCLARRL